MKLNTFSPYVLACCLLLFLIPGQVRAESKPDKTDEVVKNANNTENGVDQTDLSLNKIEVVEFTVGKKRDPFVSIVASAREKLEQKRKFKSRNPLENYDIADFKLLGIIQLGKQYFASVVLPDQKAYTLKKGMQAGIYGGRVDRITFDKIIFKEMMADFSGKLKPKYTEIKLRKEEEQ